MSDPTPHTNNSDDTTIAASNCASSEPDTTTIPKSIALNARETQPTRQQPDMGISDSGATGHFLVAGAPVTNKRIATKPNQITLPDGNKIWSSHTCNLDIPWLPHDMTAAHIVPGLSHASLIATRQFCDAGGKVIFDQQTCKVIYQGKTVLQGNRDPKTQLWTLPINPTADHTNNRTTAPQLDNAPTNIALNAYTMPTKQQAVKFMHQVFFCPPIHTLIKAINNRQL